MSERVVIVGAGIVGLCIAEALSREGVRVTVVERGGKARDGASFGNAGLIVPSHFQPLAAPGVLGRGLRWLLDPESPFFVHPRLDPAVLAWGWHFVRAATRRHVERAAPVLRDLHLASRRLHLELAARVAGAPRVETRGLLLLCATPAGLREEIAHAERAARLGLRADVLDAATAGERLGASVRAEGAVHVLDDAHVSPGALMRALQDELVARGVTFAWDRTVVGFDRDRLRVRALRCHDGERIPAESVVIAAGAETAALGRTLGARWPMQAGRGYSVTVADPPERPVVPAILSEAKVAVTPLAEGVRLGGTMEIAARDRPPDPRRVRGIARAVERSLPAFRADDVAAAPVWHGARPLTPDGLPYLGRPRRIGGLVVASGHGMLGLSLAPVTGAIVADLVQGRPPLIASPLLDPDRYTLDWRS
jgi:D-amino-acid dehydrogenase